MSRDLDQLLHDTAATPGHRPASGDLVRRGRRRRRRRHVAGATSAVMAVIAIGTAGLKAWPEPAPQIVDQPQDPAPPQPPPNAEAADVSTEDHVDGGEPGAETAEPPVVVRGCGWPATVGMRGDERTTALYVAVAEGDIAEAEAQLRQGADPDVIDERQTDTPLAAAVFSGCVALVELLLDAGADPELVSAEGTTPITHAVNIGDPEIVDLLLGSGADPSQWIATSKSNSALHEAVGVGRLSLLPRLLAHATDIDVAVTGGDPLATGEDFGIGSALEFAAERRGRAVTMLLDAGATPTRTAIYRAVRFGQAEIVSELIAAGAPLDAAPSGRTLADLATEQGHEDLARYLRDAYGVGSESVPAKTARLNDELARMIRDAGFESLGGDHDIGYATNTVDDGAGFVGLSLSAAEDFEEQRLYDGVDVYGEQDGGGASVELGTLPDGTHVAILYCDDVVLGLSTFDGSEQGRQRADRIARLFAAGMGCPTDL